MTLQQGRVPALGKTEGRRVPLGEPILLTVELWIDGPLAITGGASGGLGIGTPERDSASPTDRFNARVAEAIPPPMR